MAAVHLRFLGCGDAFGSGGRMQTCFHLDGGGEPLLIDCGATSLQALKREGVDPATIGAVALTHLHGDHFGGLTWLLLEARFDHRSRPLIISGPAGTEERLRSATHALYPGAEAAELPFPVTFLAYAERQPTALPSAVVTPFEVVHRSGAPSYGLRIEYGGRVIAYSGDTEWTDSLLDLARGADLFVCECNFFDQRVQGHLDYHTLQERREQFDCGRMVLTHMSQEMLDRVRDLGLDAAYDGLLIELP
jgi:ribonuclease BN (tRNA processing enzyme)